MDQFETFCKKFASNYTYDGSRPRTLGLEKEIIATDSKGSMALIAEKIWPYLLRKGTYKPIYDTFYRNEVIGFEIDGDLITLDAGKGTFEIVLQPYTTIRQAEIKMRKLLRILYSASEKEKIKLLGIGFQPRTKPARSHWNRKQRYEVILDVFKKHCYTASLSASDQVHIDVSINEMIPVANMMNRLSGFMIAMFANSPLRYGKCSKIKAYRELIWDDLSRIRTGVPQWPFASLEDYLSRMWDLNCILAKKGPKFFTPERKFREYVKGMSPQKTFNAYAIHEASIWHSARLRSFGTIEVRPAGLQPWKDKVVVAAFVLGVVENYREIEMFLKEFRWNDLRQLRYKTARSGFACTFMGRPVAEFAGEILRLAEEGLKRMKKGDERYLKSLWKRVRTQECPADASIKAYRKGGLKAVLRLAELKKSHLNT